MWTGLIQRAHQVKFLVNNNSTTILTAVGVVGTVSTAVLTGRASFKAAKLIDEEKAVQFALWREGESDIPPAEPTKLTKTRWVWKLYIPPVGVGVTTVASIIMANKISSKKIAALGVAAGISERALQEYKAKVVEKLGERQSTNIRDEIAQDRVTNNPPKSGEVIMVGAGQVLCYDMLTGRYFNSTVEDIKRAENKVNYELIHYMSCSLSHFYDEIGLPPTPYTDSVGWNTTNHMEVKFSTVMSEDQRPCIAIEFSNPPIADFDKHWT
jgi:hypothetical protein